MRVQGVISAEAKAQTYLYAPWTPAAVYPVLDTGPV